MTAVLQEGTLFAGRYRVLRRIAAGGMGAVYEVLHVETDRRRALKVMLAHMLQSDDMRERFKREAKVAAHIDSDYIVEVFDAGVDEATQMPFLVMELLKGEELAQRLKRLGKIGPDDVVTYLHQTALALDKTHRASIVHRDLKPENLFLYEREDVPPRVKVLDFGVAKVVAESATASGSTQTIGTPLYMAPEQYNPHAHLTGAADIYALGMVAYTLLVGAPYWVEEVKGGNIYALAAVAIHGPREPASARAARRGRTLSPSFDAWFARITAAHPAHRFPTASEAVRALAVALGVPAPARATAVSSAEMLSPPTAAGISNAAPAVSAAAVVTVSATSRTTPMAPPAKLPTALVAVLALSVAAVSAAAIYLGLRLVSTSIPEATAPAMPTPAAAEIATGAPTASAADATPNPAPVESAVPSATPAPSATASAAPSATAKPRPNVPLKPRQSKYTRP